MKVPLTLKYWNYGLDYGAIPAGLALEMQRAPDPQDMIRFLCGHGDVSFEELCANPGGVRPRRPPSYVQAAPDNGARLELCPPDVAAELRTVLDEVPDARFSYSLCCRRILDAMNSAYRDSPQTLRKYPVNWAYMNPDDMREEGIDEHALVEIESEFGRIRGVARAEKLLRRGVVSMTHLYGSLGPSTDPYAQRGSHTGQLSSLEKHLGMRCRRAWRAASPA